MKKLFNAIRHGDYEEVKATLENCPEALDEAATRLTNVFRAWMTTSEETTLESRTSL